MVRSGFQPFDKATPKDRITSLSAADPLLGSPAPPAIQAVSMVADDDNFVKKCTIDDTNDVPERSSNVILFVDKVED